MQIRHHQNVSQVLRDNSGSSCAAAAVAEHNFHNGQRARATKVRAVHSTEVLVRTCVCEFIYANQSVNSVQFNLSSTTAASTAVKLLNKSAQQTAHSVSQSADC